MRRLLELVTLAALLLFCLACDPPNFHWPDRIPELKTPPVDALPTPFDRWKEARLAQGVHGTQALIAGAATVDLTPPDWRRIQIAGYNPNKQPTGLGYPITGRILFLDDGKQSLFLVMCDFVGVMNDDIWKIRNAITRRHQDDVMFSSTHNHAGPDTMGMWGQWAFFAIPVKSGKSPAYMQFVAERLREGAMKAVLAARPAALFATRLEVPEGVSYNSHREGWKDNEMTLLQARDLMGVPIGTVINYTCHAEYLGGDNSRLSPDWPGFLYRDVEALQGGVAMFANGALGGIVVPAMPRRTEYRPRLREKGARAASKFLASLAGHALLNAENLNVGEIRVNRRVVELPIGNENFVILGKAGIFSRPMHDNRLFTEVWRIDLGALAITTVPGEFFPSLGFKVKGLMPSRYKMVVGLANDELGYIMDTPEWTDDLYTYERTVSVGPETGPRLLSAIGALYAPAVQPENH